MKTSRVLLVVAVLACGAKAAFAEAPVVTGAPVALRSNDLSSEDLYIKEEAETALKDRQPEVAQLFLRLMSEGTQREKMAFITSSGRPYRFPERFYQRKGVILVNDSICEWITKTI